MGTALAMAGAGLAFGHAQDRATIMVAGLCYTAVSNVFSNAYHVYQAEIFPTALRATAIRHSTPRHEHRADAPRPRIRP
ncbi:hypothetical protein AB0H17_18185 [Streptomyces olivoreticuli]